MRLLVTVNDRRLRIGAEIRYGHSSCRVNDIENPSICVGAIHGYGYTPDGGILATLDAIGGRE